MAWSWIRESPPLWDEDKARIVGGAGAGIFELPEVKLGGAIPCEWWRVEQDGRTVGYGWMDTTWGEAEILLAVAPEAQAGGAGSFILDHLDREAAAAGLNYMYNVVRDGHPEPEAITAWLRRRGFELQNDGRLLRKVAG